MKPGLDIDTAEEKLRLLLKPGRSGQRHFVAGEQHDPALCGVTARTRRPATRGDLANVYTPAAVFQGLRA